MPENVQAPSLTRLPWPNGSIISARLMASDIPGTALLILGSYRLLAEVPPNMPMGEVWMQLMNREMPARFRLLSNTQALYLLVGMLETAHPKGAKEASAHSPLIPQTSKQESGERPEWPHMNNPQRHDGKGALPWHGEAASDGNALLWYDKTDEQPRGMLHRHIDDDYFILSGRVDLDELNAVAFSLQGKLDEQTTDAIPAWKLRLHTAQNRQLGELRDAFTAWLQQQHDAFPNVSGELEYGLPDGGPGGLSEHTA
ncbi:MAG: hypothetical protein Q9M25_01790 [Mariprofundaceae bacterium]|nr:hypothetical protein [Mariprofundaceae bacterium]